MSTIVDSDCVMVMHAANLVEVGSYFKDQGERSNP
jgi:hypothetical protein